MEFKSREKWKVQRDFSITEKQLNLAIKRMKKRHPKEYWVIERIANNDANVCYLKLEFVEWLKEVYFSSEYYLDAEIKFFENQINRLEKELNISHKEFVEKEMTIRELCNYYNKSVNSLYMSLGRMRKNTNIKTKKLEDGRVIVSIEGIVWLNKNCYREAYLEKIESYKLKLQEMKQDAYEQSR